MRAPFNAAFPRLTTLIASALMAWPAAAADDAPHPAFKKSRLFVNQETEQDSGRTFGFGLDFSIAPVRAAEQKAVQTFLDSYEGSDDVLAAAQYIDAEELRSLTADEIRAKLKEVPEISDDAREGIDQAFEAVGGDTALVADLIEIMQSGETAVTFSLEPYFELDFDYVDFRLSVPLAGFSSDADTDFAFGNLGLDVRGGGAFGNTLAFSITGGLEYWIPSATSRANAVALSNLVASPRFFHEYTTMIPYLVVAGDLKYVQLQGSVAYDIMVAVKGSPIHDTIQFLHWGASLAITAIPYVAISCEFTGLVPTVNAKSVDSVFATTGLRFAASWMDLGLGFQIPLTDEPSSDAASAAGVSFGHPASFNAFVTAVFGF
ncbi:MAG: hypothetical protein IV100_08315 [Myxococcales bacterium]|nr:hypothetical protein [Myxococcales bacterium]